MNFDEAVSAHVAWKQKLTTYLRKPDGSLKAVEVAKDNQCVLGKWIYGEGSGFKSLPEYETLRKAHADFHQEAADIIKRADSGVTVSAEIMMGSQSKYNIVSTNVIMAIKAMERAANGIKI